MPLSASDSSLPATTLFPLSGKTPSSHATIHSGLSSQPFVFSFTSTPMTRTEPLGVIKIVPG